MRVNIPFSRQNYIDSLSMYLGGRTYIGTVWLRLKVNSLAETTRPHEARVNIQFSCQNYIVSLSMYLGRIASRISRGFEDSISRFGRGVGGAFITTVTRISTPNFIAKQDMVYLVEYGPKELKNVFSSSGYDPHPFIHYQWTNPAVTPAISTNNLSRMHLHTCKPRRSVRSEIDIESARRSFLLAHALSILRKKWRPRDGTAGVSRRDDSQWKH